MQVEQTGNTKSASQSDGLQADLWANCFRKGTLGLLAGWLTSPGFRCVAVYRLAHWLRRKGRIGRGLSVLVEQINARRGCFISSQAVIGPGLRMPHPTSIVIGEGSVIGRNAVIYQNVTLGRKNATDTAYPHLDDDVTVYAGAVLIGGIHIAKGAIIGAQCFVRKDVPSNARCLMRAEPDVHVPPQD